MRNFLSGLDRINGERLIQYMDMLARGTFSTISHNVFLDLVQWYSLLHTKQMRYSSEVQWFWHIGKIDGIVFMEYIKALQSGDKNETSE